MSDPGTPIARRSGGCQCGAVRFAAVGEPEEVSVCYCRMCQKAGGGPFLSLARYEAGAIVWTRGRPATFQSSSIATRGFCPACGTPLIYQWKPEALSLTTGSFDDPNTLPPTARFGIEARLAWTDGLAALPSGSTDEWFAATPGLGDRFVTHQHPDHDT